MSMELDRICTVDISLATPISDNASFDNILILGPAPAKPKGSIEAVAAYSGLDELTALGVVAAQYLRCLSQRIRQRRQHYARPDYHLFHYGARAGCKRLVLRLPCWSG